MIKKLLLTHDSSRILAAAPDYLYVLPDVRLRPYISNYTITFPNQDNISDGYTIIPNGSATLVFCIDGKRVNCELFGAATRPLIVGKQANTFNMLLIVEFQPWGLHRFIGTDQSELADRTFAFGLINPSLQSRVIEELEKADNADLLLGELDRLFLGELERNGGHVHGELLLAASKRIIDKNGAVTGRDLSEMVHYSERHLNRIFHQCIGTSVKSFARLVRINKAVRVLQRPQTTASLAAELLGYYDPSHFNRDFKRICNVTPSGYLENLSDYYNEICKF